MRKWQVNGIRRLKAAVGSLRAGVEVRYQAETADYARHNFLGKSWTSLEQVFVPPRLLPPPTPFDPDDPPEWTAADLHYFWPELAEGIAAPVPDSIDADILLRQGRLTLLTGVPGCGKTTLLAHMAYRCAAAAPGGPDDFLVPVIPALIHLAELDLAESDEKAGFDILVSALQKQTSVLTTPGLAGLLRRKLHAGQMLLLLDGWDDLANREREPAISWLEKLLVTFPSLKVIAAAPLSGYAPLLRLGFAWTCLLPWRAGQVETFAGQWVKALQLSQPPKPRLYWRPGQPALETQLRFWLLTVDGTAERNEGERPFQQLDVFTRSLPLFLPEEKNKNRIIAYWGRLAYALLAGGKGSLSLDEAALLALETADFDNNQAAALKKTTAHTPVFVVWPGGGISFRTSAWRDFMAACFMAETGRHDEAGSVVGLPIWAGALRFYVGRAGAANLASLGLKTKELSPTRDVLFQIASWLPEAPDSGDWRRQTMILLGQMARQATFARILRLRAIAALAQSAESGVHKFLVQLMERSDPFLRQAGAAALPALAPGKVIDRLMDMLADGNGLVRQTAVFALSWIHHPEAERGLVSALVKGDDDLRRAAIEGLVAKGRDSEEILREALEDEDLHIRRAAVYGMTLFPADWVEPALVELSRHDPEWLVRTAAVAALEQIHGSEHDGGWQPLPISQQEWLLEITRQEGRNVPQGPAVQPFLVQLLTESESADIRTAAAVSLAQLADGSALTTLETAVRDPDEQVRQAAFAALCRIQRAIG